MLDKKIIGIDLGGTTTKFAIVKPDGTVQQRWSIQTDILNNGNNIVPNIVDTINEHLKLYNMKPSQFYGIGMGTPGTVDYEDGTVSGAYNLNWDRSIPVKQQIEAGTGMKLTLENDANVAALGEQWEGAGNNTKNMAFVTLGTGVGGGVVVDGKIDHGNGGSAGEFGHIVVEPNDGFLCTCGKHGCLETIASATGNVRVAHHMALEYAGDSKLKAMLDAGEDITSKDVFDLAQQNDDLAMMVVNYVTNKLGLALSIVGVVLNPEFIIIGGGVSNAGVFLLDKVTDAFNKYVFNKVGETTTIRLATLGNEAGVIGAASLVKNRL